MINGDLLVVNQCMLLEGYDRVGPPLKSTENLKVMVLSTLVSRSQTNVQIFPNKLGLPTVEIFMSTP